MITTTNILLLIIAILLMVIIQGLRKVCKSIWGVRDAMEIGLDLMNSIQVKFSRSLSKKSIRKYSKIMVEEAQKEE